MGMRGVCVSILILLVGLVASCYAFPMEDLVLNLPGQPQVNFRQFAGYIDVDLKVGRSLFYYFVEAEKDPQSKPLTLWLNGGPGCSSVGGGAFTTLGPFLPRGDGRGLRRNELSWNQVSNLLFVESPAGVGWSYFNTSSDYKCGDACAARDMRVFLIEWFKKFPAFRSRDLFLTGESYAGHYIPQLAIELLDYNTNSTNSKFNIKRIAIGNPLMNERDEAPTFDFFWSHGMISDEVHLAIKKECDFEAYNLSESCKKAMQQARLMVGPSIDPYNIILDACNKSIAKEELIMGKTATKMSYGVDVCMNFEISFYFNLHEVQKALHANRTKLPYPWIKCGGDIRYNQSDMKIDILPVLKQIINDKISVWVFSGDLDFVIPLLDSRSLVRKLANELNFTNTVPYGAWMHENQVGGWTIEYGNLLTFATVRGAGHKVPQAQPSRALHLFSTFVDGRRLSNTTHPLTYN